MKSVVAQPRADQPRVVFVVLSVSELCVSLEGDFLSKMQSVEMFFVCSDSYAAPEALGFTALCGAPGMKVANFDMRCLLRSDGEKSAWEEALLRESPGMKFASFDAFSAEARCGEICVGKRAVAGVARDEHNARADGMEMQNSAGHLGGHLP